MNFRFKPRLDIDSAVPRRLLEAMHEKALEVLNQIGIRVTNRRLLDRVANSRGFEIRSGWVRIHRDLIDDLVDEVRERDAERAVSRTRKRSCCHSATPAVLM